MANNIDISDREGFPNDVLRKSFQSANINFLIGSGCSLPAINPLGNIEKDIQELLEQNNSEEAEKKMCEFLKPFVTSTSRLISGHPRSNITTTRNNYSNFLGNISHILAKRKNNILPKQATIFTTNYDLFIEKVSDSFGQAIKLNDGFNRSPRLNSKFAFSASEFFNRIYNNGNLYNYQVEIPSINLIKLHGSLSWQREGKDIMFAVGYLQKLQDEFPEIFGDDQSNGLTTDKVKEFNDKFSIILPRKDKFRDTLLNQIYYDLLRIYANELDKENTLLIAEGFSFADEHILDITKRALRNLTLELVIFCYQESDIKGYESKFAQYNNVDIVYCKDESLDFAKFNELLKNVLPENNSKAKDIAEDEGTAN